MQSGEVFVAQQAMTRTEALRSYTLDNAYSEFAEHLKGSITPGKLADLVVLDGDYAQVDEMEIKHLQVDHTIVGGEIRYSREDSTALH
jgi:predicted amidohydrolase YtcJ